MIFFFCRVVTDYKPFYGGFEEIVLLEVEAVFHWLYKFGLDVLLGINEKKIKAQLVYGSKFILCIWIAVKRYNTSFHLKIIFFDTICIL